MLAAAALLGGAQTRTVVSKAAYQAVVDEAGRLTSLRIGEAEALRGPLEFCPDTQWTAEKQVPESASGETRYALRTQKGTGEIRYRFEPQRIALTLTHRIGGYKSWRLRFGEDVLCVESLQNVSPGAAEAIQYTGHGEVRPIPLVRTTRIQRARLYLRNGARVLFWHDGWGAPFNLDEIGSFQDHTYTRNLLDNDKPMRLYFQVEAGPGEPLQPAPAFVPAGRAFGNVFESGQPIRFVLRFTEETRSRLKSAARWQVRWSVRDFRDMPVTEGAAALDTASLLPSGTAQIGFPLALRGWFQIKLALTPERQASPAIAPSEFLTRFAVVSPAPGLETLPDPETKPDDYAYAGLLGMRCVRESHTMRQYFPAKDRVDWQALDKVIDHAASEARRRGVNWFFQANEAPAWCTPEDYEEIAFQMVTRYKDRCRVWEVENEPNFRMTPADYVTKRLVPFAKGAKRADPACRVLGPSCVSVPITLLFLKSIVELDALKYLDGVSTHTYVGPGEPWELFGNPQYLALLRKAADGREIWQTEQGYQWGHVSKQEHARYVVRQFLNGYAAGITNERHFYFYPVHNGFEPWYLVESGSSEGKNGTLEPAGVAVRVLNEQTGGLKLADLRSLGFGIYGLRFVGDRADRLVLWTLDHPVTVLLKGAVSGAADLMGNPILLRSVQNSTELQIDGYPRYITLPHDAQLAVSAPALGVNYASAAQGAVATASSETREHPAAQALEGRWSVRDGVPGLNARAWWEAAEAGASEQKPAWIEVTFPEPRTLQHALLIMPLSAVDATPRDFRVEVSDDGVQWRRAAEVQDSTSWIVEIAFETVRAKHVRVVVTRLNDGWHLDGKWMFMVRDEFTRYTNLQVKVLSLMLFGPARQAR